MVVTVRAMEGVELYNDCYGDVIWWGWWWKLVVI